MLRKVNIRPCRATGMHDKITTLRWIINNLKGRNSSNILGITESLNLFLYFICCIIDMLTKKLIHVAKLFEVWDCLLSFGAESFVFYFAVKKIIGSRYRELKIFCCFCGYGTWSLRMRVEHRPRVFENIVLRNVFGPKRKDLRGNWRRLHNEELNNLYSLQLLFG